jgi:hypothetical protein
MATGRCRNEGSTKPATVVQKAGGSMKRIVRIDRRYTEHRTAERKTGEGHRRGTPERNTGEGAD